MWKMQSVAVHPLATIIHISQAYKPLPLPPQTTKSNPLQNQLKVHENHLNQAHEAPQLRFFNCSFLNTLYFQLGRHQKSYQASVDYQSSAFPANVSGSKSGTGMEQTFYNSHSKREKAGGTQWSVVTQFSSVQFNSVAQSCPTLCNPMNCSTQSLVNQ